MFINFVKYAQSNLDKFILESKALRKLRHTTIFHTLFLCFYYSYFIYFCLLPIYLSFGTLQLYIHMMKTTVLIKFFRIFNSF